MKKILVMLLAALVIPVAAFCQSSVGTGSSVQGKYSATPLALPPGLILTGAASWGTTATTNLANGWTNSTISTNLTQVWIPTNSPPSMVWMTNYYTNSTAVFAQFSATACLYNGLEIDGWGSTSVSNIVIGVEKSVTGTLFAANTLAYYTNSTTAGVTNASDFLINMGGYGFGRVTSITFQDTSTGDTWTNVGGWYSVKQGAAQ